MKPNRIIWIQALLLPSIGQSQVTMPYIPNELLDSTNHETLGLKASPAVTTVTIFSPTDETMHYATNKEDVEYTMVDLNALESLNSSADNLN